MATMDNIKIFPDKEALSLAAVESIAAASRTAIKKYGCFNITLAGGSTPNRTYEILAEEPYLNEINWGKTHIFLGDERCVPRDHPDSNFRSIYEVLLSRVPVPADNIHPIDTGINPVEAAAVYESTLRYHQHPARGDEATNSTNGSILFDLVLLGLGEDGHTASIFPDVNKDSLTKHWVIYTVHKTPPPPLVDRITLTPAALNSSSKTIFLVSGNRKAPIVKQILGSTHSSGISYPAQLIKPIYGKVCWLLDEAAASQL